MEGQRSANSLWKIQWVPAYRLRTVVSIVLYVWTVFLLLRATCCMLLFVCLSVWLSKLVSVLSFHVSVCTSNHLFIYPSFHSIHPFIYLSTQPLIYLPVCPSIHPSIHQPVCLSVWICVCLIHPCVCPCIQSSVHPSFHPPTYLPTYVST